MALTEEEKQIITATVPILEAGGETLTSHFYARMMKHNPEVRKFFNQTHQKDGSQARALAGAVLAYAKNIYHLENLGPVASTIIEKHVALDIHAEHYPIVGENLIASMSEVLGPDTATPAVLSAWTAAYNQLADILIAAESKEYDYLEHCEGGWSHFRPFVVKRRSQETKDIVSLWLEPEDGKNVIPIKPGQYISLRTIIDGSEARRNYSVSCAPSSDGYRITVKNIGSVSNWIHSLKSGDIIELRPPTGEFVMKAGQKDVVLIAGGVGVTPLASMALSNITAKLLYYAHSEDERALLAEIKELPNIEVISVGRRPTVEDIKANVSQNSNIYLTGPIGFMKAVRTLLHDQRVPEENINLEFFGSKQPLE